MAEDVMPAEAFNQVPANARPHGFHAEVDGSLAGGFQVNQAALIVAQRLAAGTVPAGEVALIPGDGAAAKEYFGRGSLAARMVAAFREGNKTQTLYVVTLDDDAAGVAASLTLSIGGAATATGILSLYVGADVVRVGVAKGDAAAAVATAIVAAITAATDLPVTAAAGGVAGDVVITFRHKGEAGNSLRIALNVRGFLGGEKTPAGLTVGGLGVLSDGAGNPVQTAAFAAMADKEFDYICMPYTDSASLDDWSAEMDDRWGPLRQIYGTVWTCRHGSLSELATFGGARNDKFITAVETFDSPGPAYERAARYCAQGARALTNHPARPLQTLALTGEMAPPEASRWIWSDRNTLLYGGMATTVVDTSGVVRIDRAISLYQRNDAGDPDTAFLDITTPATLTRLIRELRFIVNAEFIQRRCLLVDDGTPIAAGIPYATPTLVKARLLAHYDRLMLLGLAERKDAFEQLLIVSRDPSDPTRLNVRYTPDLANPLIIFAAQVQFSLQWPAELTS